MFAPVRVGLDGRNTRVRSAGGRSWWSAGDGGRCDGGRVELGQRLVGGVGAEHHEHGGRAEPAVDRRRRGISATARPPRSAATDVGDRLGGGIAGDVVDDRRRQLLAGRVAGRRPACSRRPASAVVIAPAEPPMPLALATTTVAPVVVRGGSVVAGAVVDAGRRPARPVAGVVPSPPGRLGAGVTRSPAPPSSSSVIARRIRKPAITATTASTMLSVEPTGEPESPTRWGVAARAPVRRPRAPQVRRSFVCPSLPVVDAGRSALEVGIVVGDRAPDARPGNVRRRCTTCRRDRSSSAWPAVRRPARPPSPSAWPSSPARSTSR